MAKINVILYLCQANGKKLKIASEPLAIETAIVST